MFGSVKLFRFQSRLSENQLDAQNFVYCPHLEHLETIFLGYIYNNIPGTFSATRGAPRSIPSRVSMFRNRSLRFSLALWQAFRRFETIWKRNSSIFNVTPTPTPNYCDQNTKIFVLTPPPKKTTNVFWAE